MPKGEANKVWIIPNNEATSQPLEISDYKVFAIMIGTITGATFTFTGSETKEGTYVTVTAQDGTDVSIMATDDRIIGLDAAALEIAAIPWLRIVSASNEAAARNIILMCKK